MYAWKQAAEEHEDWLSRLVQLAPAVVLATRPVVRGEAPYNEALVWTPDDKACGAHIKVYLPDEDGFWEATWYRRGPREFVPVQAGPAQVGFLICTEIWFQEHARAYGKQGLHLIACPRATPASTVDKWIAGGRTVAVVSGAYCLSSNRGGHDEHGNTWGGNGWIIDPEGVVLALTSAELPSVTLDLDLNVSEAAKFTYPRYVPE